MQILITAVQFWRSAHMPIISIARQVSSQDDQDNVYLSRHKSRKDSTYA
jgi:hypothetical protein